MGLTSVVVSLARRLLPSGSLTSHLRPLSLSVALAGSCPSPSVRTLDRVELTSPDTKNVREGLAYAAWRSQEYEVTLAGA